MKTLSFLCLGLILSSCGLLKAEENDKVRWDKSTVMHVTLGRLKSGHYLKKNEKKVLSYNERGILSK